MSAVIGLAPGARPVPDRPVPDRPHVRPGESDLDLLVEFGPMDPYERADAYFGFLNAIRSLLGADVDLVVAGAVKNRYIQADIERTKQVFYAA